jgi:hypothetical protein
MKQGEEVECNFLLLKIKAKPTWWLQEKDKGDKHRICLEGKEKNISSPSELGPSF